MNEYLIVSGESNCGESIPTITQEYHMGLGNVWFIGSKEEAEALLPGYVGLMNRIGHRIHSMTLAQREAAARNHT